MSKATLTEQINTGTTHAQAERRVPTQTTASVPAAVAQRPSAPAISALPRADAASLFAACAASPVNPFAAGAARSEWDAQRVPDDAAPGTYTYSLVKSGPDVPPEEVEIAGVTSVEVMILWGTNVLHVDHLTPPRPYAVGEDADCDYFLPTETLGASRIPVVLVDGDRVRVALPAGARGTVEIPGRERAPLEQVRGDAEPCAELVGGHQVALPGRSKARIELGGFVIQVTTGNAGKRVPRGIAASHDYAAASYFGMSLLAHAGFLATLAFFVPPLSLTDDEEVDQNRIYLIQAYLNAAAERERPTSETQPAPSEVQDREGGTGDAHRGESGSMGKPTSTAQNRHYQVKKQSADPDTYLARQQAMREAAQFGMIGLLSTVAAGDPNAPTSPFGRPEANGRDQTSSLGNMWGAEGGEAFGIGGLGLSGIGEGGGGRGEGVGLGDFGGLGQGAGTGWGQGFGPGGGGLSHGRLTQDHKPKAPGPRYGIPTVSGRLPPEVIQRIVRQNYGRFRLCYERGLAKNPTLEGRVAVRFVIDRSGAVSSATNGGSDMPSPEVVDCVVRAYYGLSFPQPEGGIVTVAYPIMFSPG